MKAISTIQGEFKLSQMHKSYSQVSEEEKTHTQWKQKQLYHKRHPQKVEVYINGKKRRNLRMLISGSFAKLVNVDNDCLSLKDQTTIKPQLKGHHHHHQHAKNTVQAKLF